MNSSKNISKNLIYLYTSNRERDLFFIQYVYANLVYMKNLLCRVSLLIPSLLSAGIMKDQNCCFVLRLAMLDLSGSQKYYNFFNIQMKPKDAAFGSFSLYSYSL